MTRIINAKVTFHRAPIHVLERFTFKDPQTALWHFREHSGLDECVILQTCNRVELFASAGMCDPEKIKRTWASLAGLDEDAFRENLEILEGESVYHHLLRLASGLDSMVVGEGCGSPGAP
jgi:glutamyl-tRNA reductase